MDNVSGALFGKLTKKTTSSNIPSYIWFAWRHIGQLTSPTVLLIISFCYLFVKYEKVHEMGNRTSHKRKHRPGKEVTSSLVAAVIFSMNEARYFREQLSFHVATCHSVRWARARLFHARIVAWQNLRPKKWETHFHGQEQRPCGQYLIPRLHSFQSFHSDAKSMNRPLM